MSRVVLAMSGGVDSSASAVLLKEQGHEVIGLFMRSGAAEETACATTGGLLPLAPPDSHKQGCCSASDAADARRVADTLDIPFHALNFREAFGRIKDYFADEYLAGRTPNPCVQCNNWLKFGKLWDFARQVDAEFIATGHYARVVTDGYDRPALCKGLDPDKDQSYVLFGIRPELLAHILFPVGTFDKDEIRALAHKAGLTRVASKPDSQEICFVPDQDYAGFIRRYRGEVDTAGKLVTTTGEVVGEHAGYEQFTIGQRKGLGVAFGTPRYVVEVRPESHEVVIGTRDELLCPGLVANRLNWLVPDLPDRFSCQAKIRYLHTPVAAEVTVDRAADEMRVTFAEPQFGVAPGQACVLYEGDRVLGGGWIATQIKGQTQ